MQNQMQLKKAVQTPKSRELKKAVLAPVMDFNKKNKKEEDESKFAFTSKVWN